MSDVPGFGSSIAVGNASMFGGQNTGEPFLIGYTDGGCLIIPLDNPSEVVLTLIGPKIKTLDANYTPVACFYVNKDDDYIYKDAELTQKVGRDELIAVGNSVRLKGDFPFWLNDHQGIGIDEGVTAYLIPNAIFIGLGYAACSIMIQGGVEDIVTRYVFYTAEYTG